MADYLVHYNKKNIYPNTAPYGTYILEVRAKDLLTASQQAAGILASMRSPSSRTEIWEATIISEDKKRLTFPILTAGQWLVDLRTGQPLEKRL